MASAMDMTRGHTIWLPIGTILQIYATTPIIATVKTAGQIFGYSVEFGIHDYPETVAVTKVTQKELAS